MVKGVDYSASLIEINKAIATRYSRSKDNLAFWKDDEKVLQLLKMCYKTYYAQVWEYYARLNSDKGERGIRACVKEVASNLLPLIEERLAKKDMSIQLVGLYTELYDDVYALISCRSLSHFVQYMEFDKPPNQKLWKPTMHLFSGYWYYTNSMILNGDIKFISKQCFTGLGKTYSNAMTLAFIFGNDINADALYVFGASENVGTFTAGLVDLMVTERYSKVFPYYKQFQAEDAEQTANRMFLIRQCRDSGSKLRITGSSKPVNIRVVSKEKNTNGVRAKFLFLDDIAQLADANNPKAHEKDIFRLTNEWRKRNYNLTDFYMIVGGTTYSVDDILTYLLKANNGDIASVSEKNKFTSIATSNYIVSNGKAVFVRVPSLDYETDESTYPQKYPTESLRRERDEALDGGRMFLAMNQQMPLSSDKNPFDTGNIHIYETLPKTIEDGGTREKRCRAIIDPSRKGNDKTCAMFFSKDGEKHYFVDAFIDNQPLDHIYSNGKTVLEEICLKIIRHNCIEIDAEENTESTIVSQIRKKLEEMGHFSTKVNGYYSYERKKDKIYGCQTAIQSYLYFPSRRVFAANSDVGKAMKDINYWEYKDNIADDAPECCAVYVKKYIGIGQKTYSVIGSFKR
jgi:hypothetical protein